MSTRLLPSMSPGFPEGEAAGLGVGVGITEGCAEAAVVDEGTGVVPGWQRLPGWPGQKSAGAEGGRSLP